MRSVLISAVLLAAAPIPFSLADPCSGEKPVAVLECLATSYAERDINSYDDLIAEDFTFGFVGDPSSVWNRADDLKGTRELFQDDQVRSIVIELEPAAAVEPGPGPREWWLRGVASTLTVQLASSDEALTVSGVNDLLVRETGGEPSRYRIAKWVDVGKPE